MMYLPLVYATQIRMLEIWCDTWLKPDALNLFTPEALKQFSPVKPVNPRLELRVIIGGM